MSRALKSFEYFEPRTVEEAVRILFMYGREAKVLAGGVDLVPKMRKRQIQPKCLVSIQRIPGMDYIDSDGAEGLRIGALTGLRSIELSPAIQKDYELLHEAIHQIASIQVKNMGTAVGVQGGRFRYPADGLFGGKPGTKSKFLINDVPKDPGALNFASPGDIITFYNPGGGGYGDPLERDPEMVDSDVINGYVSLEKAREDYGVVIDPKTMKLDLKATQELRDSIKKTNWKS